jgi:hypothetical protein
MKRMLLLSIAIAILLAIPTPAHGESWMIGAGSDKVLGTMQTIGNQRYFVSCPAGIRVSLAKFQVRVIDAPNQHCHYPAGVDSGMSTDDPGDDSASQQAEKAERDRIRKILEAYGYKPSDSDLR